MYFCKFNNCNALAIEVASINNLSEGWGARCWYVYQIYPPAIDTLVTGMALAALTLHMGLNHC